MSPSGEETKRSGEGETARGESATLRRRLASQLLAGPPARDAVAVAERLLAIQAQDPRGARLAIRARTSGVGAADIDRELTEHRSLLITWLGRGTLHLVRSEDYPWLHAVLTPPLHTSNATRLGQEGVGPDEADRGVAVIERALVDEGPLSRQALRTRLVRAGVHTEGQAFIHLLYRAALRGVLVRGPMQGREQAYVLVRDWLGPGRSVDRERALGELARRYLAGHGPADERDLARWAGLPLRDARVGLQAIASELIDGPDGLVELARRLGLKKLPAPRLLGAFEPLLLGWRSRREVLGEHEQKVVTGGLFRSFALVRGRALATWRFVGQRVEIEPFTTLSTQDTAALQDDAESVGRFLDGGQDVS